MFEKLLELGFEALAAAVPTVIGGIGALLVGIAIGAAVVAIVYTVQERITRWNIERLAKEAVQQERNEKARKAIADALNDLTVKKKEGNTVVLSASQFIDAVEQETAEIKITGTEVDSSIYEGMKVYI